MTLQHITPVTVRRHSAPWASWLNSPSLQLFGALCFAGALPLVVRFGWADAIQLWEHARASGWSFVGILLSHFLVGRIERYPGENPLRGALAAVTASYAVVLLLLVVGHIHPARSILLSSYPATLAWYLAVNILRSRYARLRLAVVPGGPSDWLAEAKAIDWISLKSPATDVRDVDGVVANLEGRLDRGWEDFVVGCASAGIPVYDITKTRELLSGRVALGCAGDIGLDALLPKRGYLAAKACVDFAFAVTFLAPAVALMALAGLAIKLDTPGPVFFVQERVGYRGRTFRCIKLRTMAVGADQAGPGYTRDADPRVTRVGRILRKYRLDELPQIFNILRGEMSWIGPRPEAVALAQDYARAIPFYGFRHAVKPGISGWAAIRHGNVGEVDQATVKLEYDFFYIKNLSLSLDLVILLRTARIVVTGFGAR